MSSDGAARTEGDSWDLASSVGATATMVAASRALASREPDPLLDDRFAEPLVRAVGHPFFTRMLDGDIPLDDEDMPLTARQRCEQIAVRTRFFDNFFRAATESGIRQAVILAAGLDARAYRLSWPAGTVVFEVDQPEVIVFKDTTLAQLGAQPAAERRAVSVDLRDDWPAALRANFFDPGIPTAWIAEGLLPYLPPDAQDRLLDHITALSAPESRLATENITDMGVFTDERARALRSGWRKHGLDFDVADLIWVGERRQASEHLVATGWDVTQHATEDLYAENGFALPEHELLAEIRRTISYLSAELR
ncbi:class I SAM-dependent methyltransferase [Mycobacterium sherrisii]|uniref:S-adenosyl-L-methionine-dependent methyltransferase n=1 Tax=Mycobacterium sherrisii TaxID=243061 RepID=A0A1E3SY45_9MYCO|nr:class I SAM-dependent methyltransferase [Mycobacterium sherrisii]MEC4763432.1 class I SAM-dependent methyltransferase [Mycobacterium sherrisii]ODR07051.1 SAM-dependent methyltransferase [Mycobacterium sherrisii]